MHLPLKPAGDFRPRCVRENEMKDKLIKALESVEDEESFIRFVAALGEDKAEETKEENRNQYSTFGKGVNGWENTKIEDFLEAAAEWAKDSQAGLEFYQKPENVWRRCADILYAGKIYE